jgi:CheY-like chemotaxis protein
LASKVVSAVARKPRQSSEPPRILVVEDDDVAVEQITNALKSTGFVVTVARDGAAAQAAVRKQLPDGIVLDLMMPKVDGFQVVKHLRSTPRTEQLPVLILTAKDLTTKERTDLAAGNVNQLILKGQMNRDQLVEKVRALVGLQSERAPRAPQKAAPKPHVNLRDGVRPTILVVEDNPDNMKVATGILATMDVTVLKAHDGTEAVEAASAKRPDIILMDINLPGMSGLDATHAIKQKSDLQNIVIIALTAKAMMGDREEILAAGCDDYLSKPVNPATLKATIQKWIRGEAS